jgi:hypothetical protein
MGIDLNPCRFIWSATSELDRANQLRTVFDLPTDPIVFSPVSVSIANEILVEFFMAGVAPE